MYETFGSGAQNESGGTSHLHATVRPDVRDLTSVEPGPDRSLVEGQTLEEPTRRRGRFTSQPDLRPAGRYEPDPARPDPHMQVGDSDRLQCVHQLTRRHPNRPSTVVLAVPWCDGD